MSKHDLKTISILGMTIPAVVSWTILGCCLVGGLYTIYRKDWLLVALFVLITVIFALLINYIRILEDTYQQLYDVMSREKSKLVEIAESARRDPLTRLYNKSATEELVKAYLFTTKEPATFIFIDVDNFKQVNDTFGHLFGDALLSELALRLKGLFRDSDIVGRIGGDEFFVLMTRVKDMEIITHKVNDVLRAFSCLFAQQDAECVTSASIGIALYPHNGVTFEELMEKADGAMYYAKKHGKNAYVVYTDDLGAEGALSVAELERNEKRDETAELPQRNFRENIADYMLKIFYEYNDVNRSVSVILDFVGRVYDLGRIEVASFSEDDKWFYCLHEWGREGVTLVSSDKATPTDDWECVKKDIDSDNIIYCEDAQNALPACLVNDSIKERGVRTAIICYILDKGKRQAAVSFEYFGDIHRVTPEERDAILTISRAICLFVVRLK